MAQHVRRSSCLAIPELLICIFENLSPKDTYSAARVCRFWANLAIPTLWRIHPIQFHTLISVLGIKLRHEQFSDYDTPTRVPIYSESQNQITSLQWERFIWLSKHVQILEDENYMSSLQLMEILSGLHSRFGGDLLPNIRCITADTIWPHKYPFITSIISPHLRSISLNDCDGLQCDAILGLLERQSPSLEELVIGDRDDPIEFTAFDSLKNLSSLKIIGPLTRGALQSILHCAELQKLSLTYFNIYVLRDSQSDREAINPLSTSPLITLPKLRMIELGLVDYVGDDLLEECMVWDVVSCPLLKEVVIFRSGKQDARWIRRIAQESPQVTQIKFVAGLLLDFEVLQQLPTFRDLVEIRILDDSRSPGMDIFPYDRIEDFLFLIPRLEVFEWRPSKNHRGWSLVLWTDVVDLESLPTITSKCSRLHRLCLPLNMRETAPKLKRMSQDIDVEDLVEPCASLKSLEMVVFSLYDEDVEDLARVMVHLVPYSADLTISVAPRLYLEQGRRMLDVRYGHRELEVKLASMVEEFRAQKRRHLI